MSDNEDLLADDLGDHSLADYNLGNEEEEQLLADDYEASTSQNVPTSISSYSGDGMVSQNYVRHEVQYNTQPIHYTCQPDTECVVPSIIVEVPNTPLPEQSTYAPYEPPPPVYEHEHAVPPAIPASPLESPQIVPSEAIIGQPVNSGEGGRARFVSERPPGAQRMPQVRDIPDSLDKVIVPRSPYGPRGRTSWRNPHYNQRYHNQYRRNNMHRGNFSMRPQFPPPQRASPPRPEIPPEIPIRPDLPIRPELPVRPEITMRPELPMRPDIPVNRPDMPLHPDMPMDLPPRPDLPPMEMPPERPMMPSVPVEPYTPMEIRAPFQPNMNVRFPYRPNLDEPRPGFGQMRPNFERPMFYPQRPQYPPRPFGPPIREMGPGMGPPIPQITIRHAGPPTSMGPNVPMPPKPLGREPEVRMLPVQLPPNLPPGGLAGKKVLINPHFKGNFQPPIEGPVKDIEDAAERFIAEQRNALARAAQRGPPPRRSPQRYIENTTIEIENELARGGGLGRRRSEDDELLRRQEEFISANRAGLRRRMRSPSPPPPGRRSVSPRRSPARRRPDAPPARRTPPDEESEYRRRLREQERLREHVVRAKEARRRRNAAQARTEPAQDRDRPKSPLPEPTPASDGPPAARSPDRPPAPDTTRVSPDRPPAHPARDRSPVRDDAEVNSTCENLTPPRPEPPAAKPSPERALTPPLPAKVEKEDPVKLEEKRLLEDDDLDDLDLILGDIDGILSDDDDTGRFKDKASKSEPAAGPAATVDLRTKLPPKTADREERRAPRQKIVFHKDDERRKEKSPPPKRTIVSSSTKTDDVVAKKVVKTKAKSDVNTSKSRQRITFDKEEKEKEKDQKQEPLKPQAQFSNRRVILQRKVTTTQSKEKSVFARIEVKTDPSKPNPGIFSRAVRTAIGTEKNRIVIKKDEPKIEYESDSSSLDEDKLLEDVGNVADVKNLPFGMTDTRLKTLAGSEVQSLVLDKEERCAKITFRTVTAAETFKRKFNNKMVAASRLAVTLR